LRAVGARPRTIVVLLLFEAFAISLMAAMLGLMVLYAGLVIAQPWLDAAYGLYIPITPPGAGELAILGAIVLTGTAIGIVPAVRAYRLSLADGMMVTQ
ncbi:MAG: FtsX-like permease family protein, partial [Pseudomonadota bacterium]